jgi:hypothetical protein
MLTMMVYAVKNNFRNSHEFSDWRKELFEHKSVNTQKSTHQTHTVYKKT